jgi:hypothetical protein
MCIIIQDALILCEWFLVKNEKSTKCIYLKKAKANVQCGVSISKGGCSFVPALEAVNRCTPDLLVTHAHPRISQMTKYLLGKELGRGATLLPCLAADQPAPCLFEPRAPRTRPQPLKMLQELLPAPQLVVRIKYEVKVLRGW